MRKLTEQERELWESVVKETTEIKPNATLYVAPRTRPQVQDISFSAVLDLHNYTIQEAYEASNKHLEEAFYLSIKKVQHITGKSGQISQEYETWARLHPRVRKIEKQNDGGAFKLWLVKNKS